MGGLVSTTRQTCKCIRALIAGEQTACRFAVAYALRLWLGGFFLACWFLRLNIFHANGLPPSGGHILSSSAKKEYGKKDAAQGGRSRPTNPPPWVGVGGVGGTVRATRQACNCIRTLIAGEQTACRCACAYEGAVVAWGVAWSVASALNGVTLLVGTRSGVGHRRLP